MLEAKACEGGGTSDNEHQCPLEAANMLLGLANIRQRKCASSIALATRHRVNQAPTTSERGKWID